MAVRLSLRAIARADVFEPLVRASLRHVLGWAGALACLCFSSLASAQQIVVNELYRGGNLTTTDEWVELVLQQDLTAAQLEGFHVGDSTGTTAAKFGAFRLQNMGGIASTFRAGTIIVLAGQTGPAEDLSYNPAGGDFNLIFRTNNARVVTVTAGADFAGDDVAWVDSASSGSTIAAGVGFCVTWDGAPAPGTLGAACGLTIPFTTNNAGARLDQDFTGIVAADWSVGIAAASLTPGQPNGSYNTIAIQTLQNGAAPAVYVAGSGGQFGRFDLATRAYTQISANAFTTTQITGMAYRTTTGVMYINARVPGATELRTVNPGSGAMTTVAAYDYGGAGTDTIGIAFNAAGSQYIYNVGNDAIFSVNPATAVGTQLGNAGLTSTAPLTGKLAFAGNTLYGAMALLPASSNGLYSFNTTTGSATSLGNGGAGTTYANLITFSNGSTLYGIDGTTLYQVNVANGALTSLGAIAGANLPASLLAAAIGPTVLPPGGVIVTPSGGSTAVTEGGATDTYTLALSAQPTADVTVAVNPNAQLTVSPSTLTFTSGNWNTPQTVTVTAVNDTIVEGPHSGSISHSVTSADARYNGLSVAAETATINDNDTAEIIISSAGFSTVEGAVFSPGATLKVTANGAPGGSISTEIVAALIFAPGTAGAADVTVAGSFVFPAGSTHDTVVFSAVQVTVTDDRLVEAIETFTLSLAIQSGLATTSASNSYSIVCNDSAAITFLTTSSNVPESIGTAGVPVVLAISGTGSGVAALGVDVVVGVQQAAGTATTPADYQLTAASLSFAAGTADGATRNVEVAVVNDGLIEGNHNFQLGFGALTTNALDVSASGLHTVTLFDDDFAGVVINESAGSTVVTEGGPTDSFTLELTAQPTSDVTITFDVGTQVSFAPNPLVITPAQWNVPQVVTVTAVDDGVLEGPHSATVGLVFTGDANFAAITPNSIAQLVSINDRAGVTVTESAGSTAVTEGGATDTYTVVLAGQPTSDVAVVLDVGAQLSLSPPNLTFTAANWNVAQTVTVTAADDAVVEGSHSATITHSTISSDPNYSGIAVAGINVDITDNDSAVVGFALANVSQPEATSPMVLTVSLSNPVASGVTLNVNSAFGTATAADFTPITGGTVTFAPGNATPQSVQVVIANDVLDEDDETFSVTLSDLVATGDVTLGTATVNATILDNDATPTLTISSLSQPEGNAGTSVMNFVVNLSPVSGRDVSFTRATVDGSATVADNDYVAIAAGLLTIPAGSTSLTIPVTLNGDTAFEGNETFSVALTGINNANPGTLDGIGTIEDDDQQPTTTTITADLPDPSVVGESYPVNVTVAAQTLSPSGSVTISDGSASCGPVALTVGPAPNSTASCNLTSTTAGAKTLTASFTAATAAFGDSSGTTSHQVNQAATTISVTGPARSRINQSTGFSFALGVNAPGSGTPTGTVTLTSGAASCTATLPATSCNLTFSALGSRTVSASYAGDANFVGSSSSGAGNAQTLVYALSDLAVTKSDGIGTYSPGELLVYTVTVRNLGADAAANIRVTDTIPAGLSDVVWSCDASGGVACPQAGGSGNLDVTIAEFPVGGLLNFTFYGDVDGSPQIANTASLSLPADTTIEDPNLGNNSATDLNLLDRLFQNGFENAAVNAAAGSFRLPGMALRGALDQVAINVYSLTDAQGEALRVYARVIDNDMQYALATRNAQGRLRLAAWRSIAGDPTLSWNARQTADGWLLQGAELR